MENLYIVDYKYIIINAYESCLIKKHDVKFGFKIV